jgi:hypothetical protein
MTNYNAPKRIFNLSKDLLVFSMTTPLYKETSLASKGREIKKYTEEKFIEKETKIFLVNTLL